MIKHNPTSIKSIIIVNFVFNIKINNILKTHYLLNQNYK